GHRLGDHDGLCRKDQPLYQQASYTSDLGAVLPDFDRLHAFGRRLPCRSTERLYLFCGVLFLSRRNYQYENEEERRHQYRRTQSTDEGEGIKCYFWDAEWHSFWEQIKK